MGVGCALAAGLAAVCQPLGARPAGQLGPDATPQPMTQQKVKPESAPWAGTQRSTFPCKAALSGGRWGAGAGLTRGGLSEGCPLTIPGLLGPYL